VALVRTAEHKFNFISFVAGIVFQQKIKAASFFLTALALDYSRVSQW
jgi:hypothetical protein